MSSNKQESASLKGQRRLNCVNMCPPLKYPSLITDNEEEANTVKVNGILMSIDEFRAMRPGKKKHGEKEADGNCEAKESP